MSYQESSGSALTIRHTGQVFELTQVPITIGRQSDNAIVLADPRVSRYHASITWQHGAYYIEDLDSANGSHLNEQRIVGPEPLQNGDVLRLGDTVFDLQLAPAMGPTHQIHKTQDSGRSTAPIIIGLLLAGIVVVGAAIAAILLLSGGRSKPVVTIQSPGAGTQVNAGDEIVLQAMATGARNITRLEVSVDDALVAVATSADQKGQASLVASQPWTFDQPGSHTISAVAYTAPGKASDTALVNVVVGASVGQGTPSATPTPTVSPSTTPLPTVPPPTTPLETAPPDAPADTPTPTLTLTPTSTPTETPTPTPSATHHPAPEIEYFQAVPEAIIAGECTTLEWGAVTNATEATIDHGIGGVGTPGSRNICPTETTTYVMTAIGPGGTTTASATVTVSAAQPDLTVVSITFNPSPPVQHQDNQVRITIRNTGSAGAGPFDWEWQPGTAVPLDGHVAAGLNTGETMVVTAVWNPGSWYANLPTVARVDTGHAVAESDETNNELQVNVQVVPPSDVNVTKMSQAGLDGYVIGGQDSYNGLDIRTGNFGTASGEAVYRGFLSFDLSDIPATATIASVELRFFQAQVVGDPYGKLSKLYLVHVDYGASLDLGDFDIGGLDSAWLTPHTGSGQWYTITSETVAHWIEQDLAAGRTRLQLRLQFSPETDDGSSADYVRIESGENALGTGNVPQLSFTYAP